MNGTSLPPVAQAEEHLDRLAAAVELLRGELNRIATWGGRLADILGAGGRALIAGNGGSAALAEHLSAELVGRYLVERRPLSSIALSSDSAAATAIANDYGYDEVFARQVRAHGRAGDVLVLLTTSGRSPNLAAAARSGREAGLSVWAITGPLPNPLAAECDEVLGVTATTTATIQEVQQVIIHLLCAQVDRSLAEAAR